MAYTAATRANLDNVKLSDITMKMFDDKRLLSMVGIMPNMLNGMIIGKIKGSDGITTASAGCTDVSGNAEIAKESFKTVAFGMFEVNPTFCPKELAGKIIAKGMKPDSSPEELAQVISQLAENGAKLDFLRYAWLGDTAIQSAALNAGVALAKYNLKDGFYKQILAGVTAKKIVKVTLDQNALLANVQKAKSSLHFSARSSAKLYATTNLYNKIEALTMSANNETAQMRMIEGVPTLYFNGFEVVELSEVSRYIYSDFATSVDFMVLTPTENLAVPMDREMISASSWIQDAKSKKWYMSSEYQADFKIADEESLVFIGA